MLPGPENSRATQLDVKRLLADPQIDVDHGEDGRHERGDQDARDHVEHAAERDVERDVVERDPARDRAGKGRDAEQHREQQHIGGEQPAERRPPAPVDELHRALHRREPTDALEHERWDGDRDRDEQPDARQHEQDEPDHHEHGRQHRQPDERCRARARMRERGAPGRRAAEVGADQRLEHGAGGDIRRDRHEEAREEHDDHRPGRLPGERVQRAARQEHIARERRPTDDHVQDLQRDHDERDDRPQRCRITPVQLDGHIERLADAERTQRRRAPGGPEVRSR